MAIPKKQFNINKTKTNNKPIINQKKFIIQLSRTTQNLSIIQL